MKEKNEKKQEEVLARDLEERTIEAPGVLIKLFLNSLLISASTFGGGFVIVSIMKKKYVDDLGWLTDQEMLDYTALAQSAPGAIAVNAAILLGWRVRGFLGMLIAVAGTIIPPITIITTISFFYQAFSANIYVALVLKGMQAAVAAVLFDVVFDLAKGVLTKDSAIHIVLMFAAFIATFFFRVNVILILLAATICGLLLAFVDRRKVV